MQSQRPNDLRVLVLAPLGRDAELTCIALREGGLDCTTCATFSELCRGIREGCGAVLVAEEVFVEGSMEELEAALRDQPPWSDLPIILLTVGGGSAVETAATGRAMERLGNVLLLERPTRVGTMLSLVRTALRARQRQYQICRHMAELEDAERSLARRSEELSLSNAELQDFAYVASHDLKEPLRGISNYAQFLLEDEAANLSDRGKERLRTVQRLTGRMYQLLDSLLDYSRAGRSELTVEATDLDAAVRDVIETMRPWLEEHRATATIVGRLPATTCDRVRVGQVFTNLIANAVKYNDSAQKRVEIGCIEEPGHGPPSFYVRDNGIGIPERFQETVFRMFRRLHQRDQYGGGTGAGLALVRRIVERHGGRIWVENNQGERGSTFRFTLAPSGAPVRPRALLQPSARAASEIEAACDQDSVLG